MTKETLIIEIQKFDPEAKFGDEVTHAGLVAKLSELKVEAAIAEIRELDSDVKLDGLGLIGLTAKLAEIKADLEAKAELTVKIREIEPEAKLEGFSLAELTAKLLELKPDPKAGAEDAQSAKKDAQAKKAKKIEQIKARKPPYYVASGKALTTKRGILGGKPEDEVGEETEIKREDLPEGGTSFEKFLKLGYIIKR